MLQALRARVLGLKAETLALYLAARDPRTPWTAKVLVGLVVAYVLSPIDLIPDFVPALGYLDDLILVPLGIALAIRLVPREVLAECRARAAARFRDEAPVSRVAGAVIIGLWVALALLCVAWGYGLLMSAR
jgi:uncharacterized membrane protein YkvA (DUF1232 family)